MPLRSAEQIINKAVKDYYSNANKWLAANKGVIEQIAKEINEARKECIEEAAERPQLFFPSDHLLPSNAKGMWKQSILSLINEIK